MSLACVNDSLSEFGRMKLYHAKCDLPAPYIVYQDFTRRERKGGTMQSVVYRRVYRFAGQAYNTLKKTERKLKQSEKGKERKT